MNASEMYSAICNSGKGETAKLTGTATALFYAMQELKQYEIPVYGGIELNKDNFKGNNISKVNFEDAKAVCKVFERFTNSDYGKLKKPVIDAEHNGLVSTDGFNMLACRIPGGFPIADAVPSGFSADVPSGWMDVVEELEPTKYNLICFRRMATILKGDELHGFLQAVRGAVCVYEHKDSDGWFHTLRLRICERFYDVKGIADMVDSLFKLGCTKVAFFEKTASTAVCEYPPIHIFGYGGECDAKGIVIPVRDADDSTGAFVMPLDDTANGKKIA